MTDTIAAIATALSPCGIGVIRISGETAFSVADRIFSSRSGKKASDFASHTVHYGALIDPDSGENIDQVLLTVFRAPASYTGEDVVEISCHGGVLIVRRTLEAALKVGSRLAEPGEFTKRAFLNGRMDLAQAEAVNDLIRAGTDSARRIAEMQLEGTLSERISGISDQIISALAQIEASIDFPDDVEEPDRSSLAQEMQSAAENLKKLISSFERGRIYREGIRLVIAGPPNAGKSSLLNALLGEARAIVTPIPGTTRDTIEESLSIKGIPVVAIDTAGLRKTPDQVEQIGVELAEKSLASADLIILVLDAASAIFEEELELIARLKIRPLIVAANKTDVAQANELALLQITEAAAPAPMVSISALTGAGLSELESAVESLVAGEGITSESVVVTNLRHKEALESALASLNQSIITLKDEEPLDLASVDLVAARGFLGEVTGETASEDLIDRIFSDFCIGK